MEILIGFVAISIITVISIWANIRAFEKERQKRKEKKPHDL